MDIIIIKQKKPRFPTYFFLLLVLPLIFSCSTSSWFPFKKAPSHKAKLKELIDKEIILIDKEEYVKVLNPKASEGGNPSKYLYIPVDEYLSKRDIYSNPSFQEGENKKESPVSSMMASPSTTENKVLLVSSQKSAMPELKRKIVIAPLDDRTTYRDEIFGDWIAEKLMREVNRRSPQVLFVSYPQVKEFLEQKGMVLSDIQTPKVLQLLNEVFGIHALVFGQLTGPYVFTTTGNKDQDQTASAIIKIEIRLIDTFSGKTLKTLSTKNPVIATKERGPFSPEKAKLKAIDMTLADLSRSLNKEWDTLDWFCRVAKLEGAEIYINAGKSSGLKVGDVMDVFRSGRFGEPGEIKGKIQISACFGIDASIGRLIYGEKPDVKDILKLAEREGT